MLNVHALFHGSMRRSPADRQLESQAAPTQNAEIRSDKVVGGADATASKPAETRTQAARDEHR